MNNQPTPETEKVRAAYHTNWDDLVNHARKLERERDEARQKYDNLATEHMLAVNKICNERDEAREEAHRFRSLHYSHLGINGSASWFPWEAK
jgi:hypothetical protein